MKSINRYLDSAVLKPDMTPDEARAAIQLSIVHEARTVCVRPADIGLALELCADTTTDVGTVLSFPHGCGHPRVKAQEAATYSALGVDEIDMVVNYGLVRAGDWDRVEEDIATVTAVARPKGILVKVILETSELELDMVAGATEAAIAAGADYVKTSTGFASGGATIEAVQTMLDTARSRIKVKASGGIRDRATAERFIEMGCARLGVGFSTTPILCDAGAAPAEDNETY